MLKLALGIAIGVVFREPILRTATRAGIIIVGKTKNK